MSSLQVKYDHAHEALSEALLYLYLCTCRNGGDRDTQRRLEEASDLAEKEYREACRSEGQEPQPFFDAEGKVLFRTDRPLTVLEKKLQELQSW